MDVVADADGNSDQDIQCFPNSEDKQKKGMEIQYDLVLGDRLCSIENQGVLSSSEPRSPSPSSFIMFRWMEARLQDFWSYCKPSSGSCNNSTS